MKEFLHRHSHHRAERGQSMVEMALMMTILLVVLSAVLDLGRGFFSFIAIQNAAAEGALYAAINPLCRDASVPGCSNPNNVVFRAQNESPEGLVVKENMDIQPAADAAALLRHLRGSADVLDLDPVRIGLWSCSGNVPTALGVPMDDPHLASRRIDPDGRGREAAVQRLDDGTVRLEEECTVGPWRGQAGQVGRLIKYRV